MAGRLHGLKTKTDTGREGCPAVVNVTEQLLNDRVLPRVKKFAADAARVVFAALGERFASNDHPTSPTTT